MGRRKVSARYGARSKCRSAFCRTYRPTKEPSQHDTAGNKAHVSEGRAHQWTAVCAESCDEVNLTSGLRSDLREIPFALRQVPSEVWGTSSGLRHVPSLLRETSLGLRDISSALREVPSGLPHIALALREISSKLREVPSRLRDIPSALREMCSTLRQVTSRLREVSSNLRDMSSRVRDMSCGRPKLLVFWKICLSRLRVTCCGRFEINLHGSWPKPRAYPRLEGTEEWSTGCGVPLRVFLT